MTDLPRRRDSMWTWIRDSEIGLKWSIVGLIVMLVLSISLSVFGCQTNYIKFYDFGGEVVQGEDVE